MVGLIFIRKVRKIENFILIFIFFIILSIFIVGIRRAFYTNDLNEEEIWEFIGGNDNLSNPIYWKTVNTKELFYYFKNSYQTEIPIEWVNDEGKLGYWGAYGDFIEDDGYRITKPIKIDNSLANYYGFVGSLNRNNLSIVGVDEGGNFIKLISRGQVDWELFNGINLNIFKITNDIKYISLSSPASLSRLSKLFLLKSDFLINLVNINNTLSKYLLDDTNLDKYEGTISKDSGEFVDLDIPIFINDYVKITIPIDDLDLENEMISVFAYKSIGIDNTISNEINNIELLTKFNKSSNNSFSFISKKNYSRIRIYVNNINIEKSYNYKIEIYYQHSLVTRRSTDIINYFTSSNESIIPIEWISGSYWNYKTGELIENRDFSYSTPISVGKFDKYYGYFGNMNKNNLSIVAVDEDNNFYQYIIQEGLIDYQISGLSLYIFKIPDNLNINYFSLSTSNFNKANSNLFCLRSGFLRKLLDDTEKSNNYLFGGQVAIKRKIIKNNSTLVIYYPIKKDHWYSVYLDDNNFTDTTEAQVYNRVYGDGGRPYGVIKKQNRNLTFKAIEDFDTFNIFIIDNSIPITEDNPINVGIKIKELGFSETKDLEDNNNDKRSYSVLILGDSYSQNNGPWVRGLQDWLNISYLINLGVSSCSVKDKSNDRTTYPYTSRPIQSNSTGNLNTLGCQIEKLKRLMEGTDLDSSESKIYTTEDQYPDVIIIEGGMNDNYDNDEKEKTYFGQFEKLASNVYFKGSEEATLGNCYIQTPMEEVDRTCFAGAYRYVVESLLNIFPNAQIFITTASGLGYWNGSVVEKRYRTAEQQRKCAALCGATIIDWNSEGQISSILTHPQGTGTQEDPYDYNTCTLPNADSSDLMHPNTRGGMKYGHLAALVIKQRFLQIGE